MLRSILERVGKTVFFGRFKMPAFTIIRRGDGHCLRRAAIGSLKAGTAARFSECTDAELEAHTAGFADCMEREPEEFASAEFNDAYPETFIERCRRAADGSYLGLSQSDVEALTLKGPKFTTQCVFQMAAVVRACRKDAWAGKSELKACSMIEKRCFMVWQTDSWDDLNSNHATRATPVFGEEWASKGVLVLFYNGVHYDDVVFLDHRGEEKMFYSVRDVERWEGGELGGAGDKVADELASEARVEFAPIIAAADAAEVDAASGAAASAGSGAAAAQSSDDAQQILTCHGIPEEAAGVLAIVLREEDLMNPQAPLNGPGYIAARPGEPSPRQMRERVHGQTQHVMMALHAYPGPEVPNAIMPRDQPDLWRYALALDTPEGVHELERRGWGFKPRRDMLPAAMRMDPLAERWHRPAIEQAEAAALVGMAMPTTDFNNFT